MSHLCLWVGHSPLVTCLSYLWNHYLFISPSILFKLVLMELSTNRQVRGCPRGGSLRGRAQGSDVGLQSCGCDVSLTVPQHHPAPGTSMLLCPRVRTSVTAILQAALRCGQATIHTTTHPVITATSPWSICMGGGPALLLPLITSGYGCTSGLTLTAALRDGANTSTVTNRLGKLGNPVYGSGIDLWNADCSPARKP